MPAPKRFSRARLQEAALELIGERGLAALTMRNLAAALGTGPMTIYNYVDGREGLEALVVEAVMARGPRPDVPTGDWRQDVRALAEAHWRTLRAHPEVIPLMIARRTVDGPTVDFGEAVLEALARGGRSGTGLLVAFRLVNGFITGFAQAEAGDGLLVGGDPAAPSPLERALALPGDRYPRLVEIARAAAQGDRTEEFRSGLDLVLAGLDG